MSNIKIKDPQALKDYVIEWEDWLDGDTIATSTWTAPAGITVENESSTQTTATIWLSGGTLGAEYALVNHIITAAGREQDQTLTIRIRSR
ncbi:phage fiber-tail adaptor protein [Tautonia plasticadhaerens]|uniref:Minor tail protein n=1 Tax=Tautonia plasticadhaerens TaxID=2527974 RepID=A0A518H268_9BACT|nr:hypothetical protein [Tautonia plasticadhaerens]QDV34910.1 hypothetical protein ElP_28070 [Tautonia plasticadhaerens]